MDSPDREWTQEELRAHLVAMGWAPEDAAAGTIPQFVKYLSNAPLTEAEIAGAQRLIAEHPEWQDGEGARVMERVAFKLFFMPCCGHLLCWVNPRLPNYCPECGERVYAQLKTANHTQMEYDGWMGTEAEIFSAVKDEVLG